MTIEGELAKAYVLARYPRATICGTHAPYFIKTNSKGPAWLAGGLSEEEAWCRSRFRKGREVFK